MELAKNKDVEHILEVVSPRPCIKEIMKLVFTSPSFDDLIRLLKAWRYWSLGALIGALLGAAVYYIAPPPYRAHAVVVVDFNLEQAWPKETDRQQFYYLERETRKLEAIAFSDTVMESIAETNRNITVSELRNGMLSLSQPADGGWNFYVKDNDPQRAAALASLWVQNFTGRLRATTGTTEGPNSFIQANVTQIAQTPVDRSISLGAYLFVAAVIFLAFGSVLVLFGSKPK
jgi:hypothetical protein